MKTELKDFLQGFAAEGKVSLVFKPQTLHVVNYSKVQPEMKPVVT